MEHHTMKTKSPPTIVCTQTLRRDHDGYTCGICFATKQRGVSTSALSMMKRDANQCSLLHPELHLIVNYEEQQGAPKSHRAPNNNSELLLLLFVQCRNGMHSKETVRFDVKNFFQGKRYDLRPKKDPFHWLEDRIREISKVLHSLL